MKVDNARTRADRRVPCEPPQQRVKLGIERRRDTNRHTRMRVNELDLAGMQQHTPALQLCPKEVVLFPIPVSRVTDDRMVDVFHMPPYLVVAAGQGGGLDEGKSRARVATHRIRQLGGCEPN